MYNYVSTAVYRHGAYASHLEQAVNTAYRAAALPQQEYVTTAARRDYCGTASTLYEPAPFIFLSPKRARTPFVAEAAGISGIITEAFLKTTGKELPRDITIMVAPRERLMHLHPQFSKPGIAGLSLNGTAREIFVVAGNLDEVMLTAGHELGHVITPTAADEKAEEAKAFAFELAWAGAIFQHDIAGLRNSINAAALSMQPARNGLHDIAFAFVKAAALAGKDALQLHSQLSLRQIGFDADSVTALPPAAGTMVSYTPLASSTPHRTSKVY